MSKTTATTKSDAFTFESLASEEFKGEIGSLPLAQLLGDKADAGCGIFIKKDQALLSGWKGAIDHTHVFASGNSEDGAWIGEGKFLFLRVSPRYAEEVSENGSVLMGSFEDPEIKRRYYDRKDELANTRDQYVRLRTLFVFVPLNPDLSFASETPLVLSITGVAAIRLSESIDSYNRSWELAVCQAQGRNYSPMSEVGRALCVYDFKFIRGSAGTGSKTSPIAETSFDQSSINKGTARDLTLTAQANEIMRLYQETEGFAERCLQAKLAYAEEKNAEIARNLAPVPVMNPVATGTPETEEELMDDIPF